MADRTINSDLERYPVMIVPEMKEVFKHVVLWESMKNNIVENEKDSETFFNNYAVQKENNDGTKVFDSEGEPVMIIPKDREEAWQVLLDEGSLYQGEIATHKQFLTDTLLQGKGDFLLDSNKSNLSYQELNVISILGSVNAYTLKGEAVYGNYYVYKKTVNSKGEKVLVKADRLHGFTALSNTVERYCYSLAEETKEAQKNSLYKANKALNSFLAYNFTFDNTEAGLKWGLQPSKLFNNYKIIVKLKKSNIMDKLILGCSFRAKHSTSGKNSYTFSKSLFWKNLITWIYTEITEGDKDFKKDYTIPSEEVCVMDINSDFTAWASSEKAAKKEEATAKKEEATAN